MVAKLKDAEEKLGAMRSEIDDAASNSEQLRAELQTANDNYLALQTELQKAINKIENIKVSNASVRSEMQTHTDQLIEQIHDEHKKEVLGAGEARATPKSTRAFYIKLLQLVVVIYIYIYI